MRTLSLLSLALSSGVTAPAMAENSAPQALGESQRQPNIILILADDLGYAGLSSFGGEGIATPHLDALVEQGAKLTNFYATSTVCTPTRVGLMTGLYPQRTGLDHLYHHCAPEGLSPTEYPSLSLHMKAQGYRTGVFGKWHLGSAPEYQPKAQGFDDFVGFLDGNIDYISKLNTESEVDWYVHHEHGFQEGYVTDLLNQAVVDFIEREQDKPFFIYLPHAAPHVPLQGPGDKPLRTDDFYVYTVQGQFPKAEYMRRYREIVGSMDDGVGMMMAKLRELGLEQDTLIIFTSDNGGERTGVRHGRVNGEHRGHKNTFYEGGLKVPALAYWKGRIEPGQVVDTPMITHDLTPTIANLSGAPMEAALDGVDLTDLLLHGKALAERPLYWQHTHKLAMREGDWKLVYHRPQPELYHLASDPLERHDRAGEPGQQARLKAMSEAALNWRAETAVGIPAQRVIGEHQPYQGPCKRDLDAFNQGKRYRWTDAGGVIEVPSAD